MPYDPMNQVHPGPTEPVDRIPADATQARTGNTEREQEMYAAGIEVGEANTKHNAAVRSGWMPIDSAPKDGTTVILGRDMDTFGFIRGYGHFAGTEGAFVSGWISKGFCEVSGNLGLANPTHWQPLPAAPGSPASAAPGDSQDDIDVLNWLQIEISALSCRYLGDPPYDHDAYWMRDRVLKLIDDAHKAFAAPAAGDAHKPEFDIEAAAQKMAECMDYPWAHMPEQGRTHMRKYAQAVIDAAIAAQQGNKTGTNSGHGHVWDRPDGLKAKCGGPGFCSQCSRDQAAQQGKGGAV
ncbi:hypothetical protein L506_2297 [Bordetella bronchiseptica GA96-01]|uniref:hypothetical protein n=1 Tax=Bordetella bronchiseptica TaxID=518 RepID=UPI00045A3400|nr:hypothetical protein [Bordetella bronchiseptica]AZW31527.1 hypothetical protein CS343_15285 [Bordetella bronchiseptica]KCV40751.1 hypothetical protein L572_2324 [Bordetella bronchiseptica 345]KDC42150.1 hypothetical protein L506_2297 [Bordetella bronchiseptica GA96-01]